MNKHLLIQYGNEIKNLADTLLNSNHKINICKTEEMHQNILDGILNCGNLAYRSMIKYLLVHTAVIYMIEEDCYEHIFFLYNISICKVLTFSINSNKKTIGSNKLKKAITDLSTKKIH